MPRHAASRNLTVLLAASVVVDGVHGLAGREPPPQLARDDVLGTVAVPLQPRFLEAASWMNGVFYRMAQREEGSKKPSGPPFWLSNQYLVKFPRSFVEGIDRLKRNGRKTRRFNFVGALTDLSAESTYPRGARDWVKPFVQGQFRAADYFQDTNPQKEYRPLGRYDHSLDERNFTKQQRHYAMDNVPFDETYYRILAESLFTLAPAGDLPYSYRFVEAALAGSIPIVSDDKYANCEHHQYSQKTIFTPKIGWHYYLTSENPDALVYNETWVTENRKKALRYHTLMQGFRDRELLQ